MSGKITFQFDDGYLSHYEKVFPLFREFGYAGCLSLIAKPDIGMGYGKALEMQAAGWEILSHSVNHPRMSEPLGDNTAETEIKESKRILEAAGFHIRQFVTPCSRMNPSMIPMTASVYDAAFTVYTDAREEPVEKLVMERPCNRFALHRACLSGKTAGELRAYVDYVEVNDAWLVFYEHDIGAGTNITVGMLRELLCYIRDKNVSVMTSSDAMDAERCRTRILRDGWNGHDCLVHARIASDGGDRMLITAQMLNTAGDDYFDTLQVSTSGDCGKTWTVFTQNKVFEPAFDEISKSVCCDVTPMYHKKTGKFLAAGHTAVYALNEIVPMKSYCRVTPYAVFDENTGEFGKVRHLSIPGEKYRDSGSGCSQCFEEENGDILMPISFSEHINGIGKNAKTAVLRCSFDGETLSVKETGNDIEVPDEVRGIGEASLIRSGGIYILTIRGDRHGYVCRGTDGIHFSEPEIWRWEDGEIVPTYNTQSHIFTLGEKVYLVYTRKDGKNDHVFRNRAPLYAAEVNRETLRLKRESEFVAVPERGARLGNFGVCQKNGDEAYLTVTEWMQPRGCEAYGSSNALWLTDFHS